MFVKITDIPPEGLQVEFPLDIYSLNERVNSSAGGQNKDLASTIYHFFEPVTSSMKLNLEGSTLVARGNTLANYCSYCSRCAEDTKKQLTVPFQIILKPRTTRGPEAARDEDVNFGYYDGQEVNCAAFAEEFLILALPYSVMCSENCKGLCPKCGANLNNETCICSKDKPGDDRFAILRNLKPGNGS